MTTFHDPREFLNHLESMMTQSRTSEQDKNLLLASVHVIKYLINSQNLLTEKMVRSVDCLNYHHESWGHKLAELYQVLEAAEVDAETMNQILKQEICGSASSST